MRSERPILIPRCVALAAVFMAALLSDAFTASAITVSDSLVVQVYFRNNDAALDRDYRDNGNRLDQFVSDYNMIMCDKRYQLVSLDVVSSSSPEGNHRRNVTLSNNRAAAIIDFIGKYVPLDGVEVNLKSKPNNWTEFREAIMKADFPEKAQVLRIIDRRKEVVLYRGEETDLRIIELQKLNGGSTYSYLKKNFFPNLRESFAMLVFKYEKEEKPVVVVPVVPEANPEANQKDMPAATPAPAVAEYGRKVAFAFKSNLLLPLLNVGFEVPLGNRWSLSYMHYYPWLWRYWPTQSNEYCFEAMWGELDLRYWFGKKHQKGEQNFENRLQGHSIGLFTQVGYYDIGWNWTGRQGEFASLGVDYLYGLSLGKGGVHMQFNIGLGYMYRNERTYDVYEYGGKLYRRQSGDGKFGWFGPLRAGVTLVVPIYAKYKKTTENE